VIIIDHHDIVRLDVAVDDLARVGIVRAPPICRATMAASAGVSVR
jgi:hypothetical protein